MLSGGEIAILDIREEGVFATGHLLFARNVPLSRLELLINDLVPRKGTPIILCGEGDEMTEVGSARLNSLGYNQVIILEGGINNWTNTGNLLFGGVFVPSKAFGEFVEATYHPPFITPEELQWKLKAKEDVLVLDSRPLAEYRRACIPEAIDTPGAELVYRIHDLIQTPETLVVVTCAGRTRSIIGGQSLINAGIANKVVVLKNGTMGWHLAGMELEHGQDRRAKFPSRNGLEKARACSARVAQRFGVRTIDRTLLETWHKETDHHSLYLLDVRSPEEYCAGHLYGSISSPGGQLVQATDKYIGTMGARIVLIDDTGVRAIMTASWLVQMGWSNVVVLRDGLSNSDLLVGRYQPTIFGLDEVNTSLVTPKQLKHLLEEDNVAVIDIATSREYRNGHIPGAWFAVRSRFAKNLIKIPKCTSVVITSDDGLLAQMAAREAAAYLNVPVSVLDGGTSAWKAAGFPILEGFEKLSDDIDDVYWRPHEGIANEATSMREYLDWETGLVDQVEQDGTAHFKSFP